MTTPSIAILESLVNRAVCLYPTEAGRIKRGAAIALAGHITTDEQGRTRVGERRYIVQDGTCNCYDFTEMQAPHGRCKHRWAMTFHRRMQQEECMSDVEKAPRSLQFYASLGNTCGVATVWEDGRILFQAHGDAEQVPCTLSEVALSGRKDLVDAALSR